METLMSYYQHHVFFCTNQREGGAKCCNDLGAQELRDYAKQRIKSLKLERQKEKSALTTQAVLIAVTKAR
jgi:hypothetical protein